MCNADRIAANKQGGVILPLVAVAISALIAVTGLALDSGLLYINKTRLQNAVDAAALSAAKTMDITGDSGAASVSGTSAFNRVLAAEGNQALATAAIVPTFNYLANFHVRAIASFSQSSILIQVLGITSLSISASAVAGPSPILENVCNIFPTVVCGAGTSDFTHGEALALKGPDVAGLWGITKGYYQYVDCGTNCFNLMAGAYAQCSTIGTTVTVSPPGDISTNMSGLNSRFNGVTVDYPPDKVIASGSFSTYQRTYARQDFTAGKALRRVVVMPIGDCSSSGTDGSGNILIKGFGCFFLTQPADVDVVSGVQTIYVEYLDSCQGQGMVGSNTALTPGPHLIVLYRDSGSPDS